MTMVEEKRALILEYEERFAHILSLEVLDRPTLNIWLILIPILFIYYIHRYQRFTTGRKIFAEKYLLNRRQALDEAFAAVGAGREPDGGGPDGAENLPSGVREAYRELLEVLVGHYAGLLRAEGDDFESLVRSAYRNRTNYLLFLNRMARAEQTLNTALKHYFQETQENVEGIVGAMELHSERLRRESAGKIFP